MHNGFTRTRSLPGLVAQFLSPKRFFLYFFRARTSGERERMRRKGANKAECVQESKKRKKQPRRCSRSLFVSSFVLSHSHQSPVSAMCSSRRWRSVSKPPAGVSPRARSWRRRSLRVRGRTAALAAARASASVIFFLSLFVSFFLFLFLKYFIISFFYALGCGLFIIC